MTAQAKPSGHERIETSNFLMIVLILVTVAIGGLVEIVPLYFQRSTTEPAPGVVPYDALQLVGRDIYVREGCYNCHSQMIRPLHAETLRYGHYSLAGEFVYDRPFQWGSKRTGPDLAREGSKYPNMWHYQHLIDPRAITAGSNMPPYAHLSDEKVDLATTPAKMQAMRTVGVPYTDAQIASAGDDARAQAQLVTKDLAEGGVKVDPDSKMVATIAYLQRLGQKPQPKKPAEVAHAP